MLYYNTQTQQKLPRYELKKLFPNVSIAQGCEEFGDWVLLHDGEMPIPELGKTKVVSGPIQKLGNEWTQTYLLQPLSAEEKLQYAKSQRADAVRAITVTVDGMTFDGDEQSQERMSRTITAAKANGKTEADTTSWVLANNIVANVTIGQLSRALLEAGQKQTEIWVKIYE